MLTSFEANEKIEAFYRSCSDLFLVKMKEHRITPTRSGFSDDADELATKIVNDCLPGDDLVEEILLAIPDLGDRESYAISTIFGDISPRLSDLECARCNLEYRLRDHLFDLWFNIFNYPLIVGVTVHDGKIAIEEIFSTIQ